MRSSNCLCSKPVSEEVLLPPNSAAKKSLIIVVYGIGDCVRASGDDYELRRWVHRELDTLQQVLEFVIRSRKRIADENPFLRLAQVLMGDRRA